VLCSLVAGETAEESGKGLKYRVTGKNPGMKLGNQELRSCPLNRTGSIQIPGLTVFGHLQLGTVLAIETGHEFKVQIRLIISI
jgi:hypothetical protein